MLGGMLCPSSEGNPYSLLSGNTVTPKTPIEIRATAVALEVIRDIPIEILASLDVSDDFPVGIISSSENGFILPNEVLASITASALAAIEFSANLRSSLSLLTEILFLKAISGLSPVEVLAKLSLTVKTLIESQLTLSDTISNVPIEISKHVSEDIIRKILVETLLAAGVGDPVVIQAKIPLEILLNLSLTDKLPLEYLADIENLLNFPLETLSSVLSNRDISVETLQEISEALKIPIEVLGSEFALSVDKKIPIEIRESVSDLIKIISWILSNRGTDWILDPRGTEWTLDRRPTEWILDSRE